MLHTNWRFSLLVRIRLSLTHVSCSSCITLPSPHRDHSQASTRAVMLLVFTSRKETSLENGTPMQRKTGAVLLPNSPSSLEEADQRFAG
ncbi:hypothetical protein B0H13DRAFT_2028604 [Mycena leptocephala]|nr:hypothetical protein B0H13DRAFT_2028604 [Mycena leptocephala]